MVEEDGKFVAGEKSAVLNGRKQEREVNGVKEDDHYENDKIGDGDAGLGKEEAKGDDDGGEGNEVDDVEAVESTNDEDEDDDEYGVEYDEEEDDDEDEGPDSDDEDEDGTEEEEVEGDGVTTISNLS